MFPENRNSIREHNALGVLLIRANGLVEQQGLACAAEILRTADSRAQKAILRSFSSSLSGEIAEEVRRCAVVVYRAKRADTWGRTLGQRPAAGSAEERDESEQLKETWREAKDEVFYVVADHLLNWVERFLYCVRGGRPSLGWRLLNDDPTASDDSIEVLRHHCNEVIKKIDLAMICAVVELDDIEQISLDMPLAAPATPAAGSTPETRKETNQFIRMPGGTWLISYQGEERNLTNLRGLEYIAQLLKAPGVEIAAIRLIAMSPCKSAMIPSLSTSQIEAIEGAGYEHGDAPRGQGDDDVHIVRSYSPETGLDKTARKQYEARARTLAVEIEEAELRGNNARVNELRSEAELIEEELKPKKRRAPVDVERARTAVTHAIDRAFQEIEKLSPKTASHLKGAIKRGYSMMYRDCSTTWQVQI